MNYGYLEPLIESTTDKRSGIIQQSNFIISLDVELQWGFYDLSKRLDPQQLAEIPFVVEDILHLFERYSIEATWGVVGALACSTVEELMEELSTIPYHYLNERCHPKWIYEEMKHRPKGFVAPEILALLRSASSQELASHTFSHFYTRELPFSEEAWVQDLLLVKKWIPEAETIIFPRNQYHERARDIATKQGFTTFRTTPKHWLYSVKNSEAGGLVKRGIRLMDHYFPFTPHHFVTSDQQGVSYSRFLRPHQSFNFLNKRKLDRIKQSMSVAAATGESYHLWWHPHNFSRNREENVKGLEDILEHFVFLREHFDMQSVTMKDYQNIKRLAQN